MNTKEVWENIEGWRHLNEQSPNVQKNIDYLKGSLEFLEDEKTLVDWGPGGGYLSKFLQQEVGFKTLDFVDISDDRFDFIKNNTENFDIVRGHVYGNSILLNSDPDVLLAYSVIYHMPSINYVCDVLSYWNDVLKPKKILIRNMFSDLENWERRSDLYHKGHNFLRGNLITKDFMMDNLKGYKILHKYGQKHSFFAGCPSHYSLCLVLERM